jgi:hypothetical protein
MSAWTNKQFLYIYFCNLIPHYRFTEFPYVINDPRTSFCNASIITSKKAVT